MSTNHGNFSHREMRSLTSDMTVREMYQKVNNKQQFGIEGYQPQKVYFDANKQSKDRELQEALKKPYSQRPKPPKPTKKGSFYDEVYRQTKGVPGPDKYNLEIEWFTKEQAEKAKRPIKKIDKVTYIDQIFKDAKKGQVPGVGKYNVELTQEELKKQIEEQKKKKVKEAEKFSFVDECFYNGTTVPGPGFYNPRKEILKLKPDTTKPEQWIKKHKDQSKPKPDPVPPVGIYKNDFPVTYDTFGKMLSLSKDKGQQKAPVKYLGTEVRFKDPKKSKSTFVVQVPGVGQYPMIAQWPGKLESKGGVITQQKNWMNNVTRGISKSIYY